MKLQELCPRKEYIEIFDKTYSLSLFTLAHEVWALDNYGSLEEMQKFLNSPNEARPFTLLEIIFELLEVKPCTNVQDFIKSFDAKALLKYAGPFWSVTNKVLSKSFPEIENITRMRDYNKTMEHVTEPKKSSYAVYYDKMASRYGYTLDQFMTLTPRQLFALLNAMNINEYDEVALQAALMGRKLKPANEMLQFSPEQEQHNDKAALSLIDTLKARHQGLK